MKELFDNKSEELDVIDKRAEFLSEFDAAMKEFKIDKNLYQMILEKLYCFGPNNSGPNIFLINSLKPQFSLFKKYALVEEERTQKGTGDELVLDLPEL